MFGVNFNAEAQLGGLVNKAKQAGKNAVKDAKNETSPDAVQQKATDAAKDAGADAIKKKWMAEAKELFENQDSTTSIIDRCRAFYYGYQRDVEAERNKEIDFRLVYADRMVISWNLLKSPEEGVKYEDFEKSKAGLSMQNPYDKLTLDAWEFVKTDIYNKGTGYSTRYWQTIYQLGQNLDVPLPFQDISGYIKGMLDKADQCKTDEGKLVCLYRVIVNREQQTTEFPQVFPDDAILYTERIKKGVASLPANLLAENPLPEVLNADELFNKRIEKYLPVFEGPIPTPDNRDAVLERQIKEGVERLNPGAKVKLVSFASDATAEWYVKKNALDVPLHRCKTGNIVVEYPGKAGMDLIATIKVFQDYVGGGKYGASDPNLPVQSVRVDKDMIFVKGLPWARCKM